MMKEVVHAPRELGRPIPRPAPHDTGARSGGSTLDPPGAKSTGRPGQPAEEAVSPRSRDPSMQAALADAFERYASAIYRFAYRRLGNRESAEDVTAQVFLKAARWMDPSFDEARRRAWLFRAARTAIIDIWRSYGDSPVVPLEWYTEEPSLPPDESDADAAARVQRLLARLSALQRRVLELRFLEGRTVAETARELGTTENHVKVLQHRALRRAAELEAGDR